MDFVLQVAAFESKGLLGNEHTVIAYQYRLLEFIFKHAQLSPEYKFSHKIKGSFKEKRQTLTTTK